jgi:broad specificity phosphatase PhoE|tara:strand:- start:12490 stop:13167 length:678 start_codon:yes stop_codon:yes gene_type:complete
MRIFLVRHGESSGNVDKSEYSNKLDCDIGLTEKGFEDAESAANRIKILSNKIQYADQHYPSALVPTYFNLYNSPYKRAIETAGKISESVGAFENYNIEEHIETPLIHEREWGDLRSIVNSRLKTEEHFNFFYKPSGGESFSDTFTRAATFHQWLINTSKYENNIVVAHGEFNKVYLMHLLNWSVEEFKKWRNQKNGEVWIVNNGILSPLTPLTPNPRYKASKIIH